MARFKGTLTGQHGGHCTRLGNDESGILAEVLGRRFAVRVHAYVDDAGAEWWRVYARGPTMPERVVYQMRVLPLPQPEPAEEKRS